MTPALSSASVAKSSLRMVEPVTEPAATVSVGENLAAPADQNPREWSASDVAAFAEDAPTDEVASVLRTILAEPDE